MLLVYGRSERLSSPSFGTAHRLDSEHFLCYLSSETICTQRMTD